MPFSEFSDWEAYINSENSLQTRDFVYFVGLIHVNPITFPNINSFN